ncbi:MAG: tetratricopeptide repeat protein [Thermoplasmata archaeon]
MEAEKMVIERLEAMVHCKLLQSEIEDLREAGKEEERGRKEEELKALYRQTNLEGPPNIEAQKDPSELVHSLMLEVLEAFIFSGLLSEWSGEISLEEVKWREGILREAIALGREKKLWGMVKKCYLELIELDGSIGKFEDALKWGREYLAFAREREDAGMISDALAKLGAIAFESERWNTAIECYEKRLEIEKEMGRKLMLAKTYANLSDSYLRAGNIAKAEKALRAGVHLCKDTTFLHPLFEFAILDAEIDLRKGRENETIEKLKKFVGCWERFDTVDNGDGDLLFIAYNLMCDAYLKKGETEKGIECLKEGCEKMKDRLPDEAAAICRRIAEIYSEKGNEEAMEEWLKIAEKLEDGAEEEEDEDSAGGDDKGGGK